MPTPHIDSTLDAIAEQWHLGPQLGPKYGALLLREIAQRADKVQLDAALALGNYLLHTQANKRQRSAVRAVLLAQFVMRKQPLALADGFRSRYITMDIDQLKREFTHAFPAIFDDNKRASWNPANFTDPSSLREFLNPEDWTNRPIPHYKFVVHSVRKGSSLMENAYDLQNWLAISMGVLSDTKPLAYSNHGLILSVPANNIITTSPTDQWFDNYAGSGSPKSTKAEKGHSMAQHIADKNIRIGGLLSPDEVIQMQNTQGAMQRSAGTSLTKHNEIVVCGKIGEIMPHGRTGVIQLLAFFIQTKMDGTFPKYYFKSQGDSDVIRLELEEAAKKHWRPLLYLPTDADFSRP